MSSKVQYVRVVTVFKFKSIFFVHDFTMPIKIGAPHQWLSANVLAFSYFEKIETISQWREKKIL